MAAFGWGFGYGPSMMDFCLPSSPAEIDFYCSCVGGKNLVVALRIDLCNHLCLRLVQADHLRILAGFSLPYHRLGPLSCLAMVADHL